MSVDLLDGPLPDGWDDLVMVDSPALPPHELYTSARWLRTITMLTDLPLEHLVLREGDELRGALVTRHVPAGHGHPRISLDAQVGPEALPARLVGGLYDGRTGPLVAPGAVHEAEEVARHLFAAAEELAAERGEASVVCRSIDAEDEALLGLLRGRGYAVTPGADHLVLTPAPGGLDGYVASLSGRYRNMLRRERRKLEAAGVTSSVVPMTPELLEEVAPLVVNLSRKHGVDDDVDRAAGRLRLVRRCFRGDVWASVTRRDGAPVGFLELMVHRGHAWGGHAGFDYELQGGLPVYFETLFYGVAETATREGWATIDYAVGTEAAKAARGCVVRPTWTATLRL